MIRYMMDIYNDIYDQSSKSIKFKDKDCVVKISWKQENNTLPEITNHVYNV